MEDLRRIALPVPTFIMITSSRGNHIAFEREGLDTLRLISEKPANPASVEEIAIWCSLHGCMMSKISGRMFETNIIRPADDIAAFDFRLTWM